MSAPAKSCTCDSCIRACKHAPGWFLPGEAERASKLLKMSFAKFCARYLVIDYWVGGAKLYAPRKVGVSAPEPPAHVDFGYAYQSATCVFLKDNRCRIHAAKPFECRVSGGCGEQRVKDSGALREAIQAAWTATGSPLGRG